VLLLHRPRAFLFASGLLSAAAAVFLFAGLASRIDWRTGPLFRAHDVLAALAFIATALSAWSLRATEDHTSRYVNKTIALTGVVSAGLTFVCLGLVLIAGASDMLYMLPQGGVGLWLIGFCSKGTREIGPAMRILGIVIGIGMILIAGCFVAIAIAQGPELWALSHQHLADPDPAVVASSLNVIGHQILYIGTLLALPGYPVWAMLASRAFAATSAQHGLPRAMA